MGSVAIVAIDDRQRVLLIRQYRHPAGHYLRELPAAVR
jgi:ADP-ribose pyrophosphatase